MSLLPLFSAETIKFPFGDTAPASIQPVEDAGKSTDEERPYIYCRM